MNYLKRYFGHLHTVNTHRRKVRHLCFKCGLYWQGLTHDLSKYSPDEFFESVKYYAGGVHSPISDCKKAEGYSKAWLHHKGRNKHHFEYWTDPTAPVPYPLIPFKYLAESICDNLAAGLTYQGKNWTKEYQLEYFKNKDKEGKITACQTVKDIYIDCFENIARDGLKFLSKKNLKMIYDKHAKDYKPDVKYTAGKDQLI